MKETLVCSSCNKSWKRELTRGRKPVICPKCVKSCNKELTNQEKLTSRSKSIVEEVVVKKAIKATPIKLNAVNESKKKNPNTDKHAGKNSRISLSDVYEDYYPHPTNYKEFMESTKNGSKWHCPDCGKYVASDVPMISPPTHRCPEKSTKVKEFKRVK